LRGSQAMSRVDGLLRADGRRQTAERLTCSPVTCPRPVFGGESPRFVSSLEPCKPPEITTNRTLAVLRSHGQIDLGIMTPASLGHWAVGSKSREPEIKAPIAHHVLSADLSPPVTCKYIQLSTWRVPGRRSLRDCVCLSFLFRRTWHLHRRRMQASCLRLDAHYYRTTAPPHHRTTAPLSGIFDLAKTRSLRTSRGQDKAPASINTLGPPQRRAQQPSTATHEEFHVVGCCDIIPIVS